MKKEIHLKVEDYRMVSFTYTNDHFKVVQITNSTEWIIGDFLSTEALKQLIDFRVDVKVTIVKGR